MFTYIILNAVHCFQLKFYFFYGRRKSFERILIKCFARTVLLSHPKGEFLSFHGGVLPGINAVCVYKLPA